MPHQIPWTTSVQEHPGSSPQEIRNEADWTRASQHRVGFKNRDGRKSGITHADDEHNRHTRTNGVSESNGKPVGESLVNFRDVAVKREALQVEPEELPLGWRAYYDYSEDFIKNQEPWSVNQKQATRKDEGRSRGVNRDQSQEEHEWSRGNGVRSAHHDAYGTNSAGSDNTRQDDLTDRYSPQEIALLKALENESTYRQNLRENDGTHASPQVHNRVTIDIDEKDQFTPDNWFPRSADLIRLTGSHPMNAEPELSELFDAGLITPNEVHYIRNHGAVPRLAWSTHKLDVENGSLVLSMDDLKRRFVSPNFPVSLACDGNRRKEANMVRKSKGFDWGSGATGCAYWKGALLRDVLLAAGVGDGQYLTADGLPRWVNFEGCDEPSEGKYATCIPLSYAMDPVKRCFVGL